MNRYIVYYRMNTDMEWSDEYYPAPYIPADNANEALKMATDFIYELGYDASKYEYMVVNYE